MKNIALLAIFIIGYVPIIFAQPVIQGRWEVIPFGDDILKITWSHPKSQQPVQISNAVIAKPTGQAMPTVPGAAQKIPGSATEIRENKQGGGLVLNRSKHQIELISGFDSSHVRGLQIQMPKNAYWFGGGERATRMDRTGQRISLYNAPAYGYGEGQDQLNYSVPFVMTTAGYGLFFDNVAKGYIDFGKAIPHVLEAGFVSGPVELYVIYGNTPMEIVQKYTTLTGTQPLPPRWALGNFVSRFGYRSQQQAEEVVAQMSADDFPMDGIIIDLFWFGDSIQHTLGNLDWKKDKWPAPEKMIKKFKDQNINTILITEPFVIEKTLEYQNSIPHLATNAKGEPYGLTEFYFGKGGIIDIFKQTSKDWFWQYYKKQNDIGVAGWWGDLGEPEHHPEDVLHNLTDYGGSTDMKATEVHNLFGHAWSQMLHEKWTADQPGKRLFFLNRAGYAGSQRYSIFPWTGDVARSWSGLRSQLPILQSMSLSGIPYIHSDAGGFAMTDKADPELYTRWLQFAAFTPVFRPHGSALEELTPAGTISLPSEPTFWDNTTKDIVRNVIKERYRLLPYHYTMAWQQTAHGKPLIRPMNLHGVSDTNLLKATDQYMWGDAILVAPILQAEAKSRKLYLPEGTWYRYHDLSRLAGKQWIEEKTVFHRIPVFVKAGSFIPYWDEEQFTSTSDYSWIDTLSIRYYPGKTNEVYYLYDDEGNGTQLEAIDHQLMQWNSTVKGNALVIRGVSSKWPIGKERVIKLQMPLGGLKTVIPDNGGTAFQLSVNGQVYKKHQIITDGKTDNWINIYCIANGKDIEIKIEQVTK